jgi:hypothetical protein
MLFDFAMISMQRLAMASMVVPTSSGFCAQVTAITAPL